MQIQTPSNAKTNEPAALQGYAPAYNQASEFLSGEVLGQSSGTALKVATQNLIDLFPSAQLPRRKIYAWIFAANSNANDFWAIATIRFFLNKSAVGTLPLASASTVAGSSPRKQSIPTICVSGGNSQADVLGLYITNPVNSQPASTVIQPEYIYGSFDEVQVSLDDCRNINDVRIFFAILSSQ